MVAEIYGQTDVRNFTADARAQEVQADGALVHVQQRTSSKSLTSLNAITSRI